MERPFKQPGQPPPNLIPFGPWLLTKVCQALLLLAVFIVGVEVGFHRANQIKSPPESPSQLQANTGNPEPTQKKAANDAPPQVVKVSPRKEKDLPALKLPSLEPKSKAP